MVAGGVGSHAAADLFSAHCQKRATATRGSRSRGQMPAVWNSYEFGYSDDDDDGFGQVDFVRTPSGSTYLYRYVLEGLTGLTANDIANYNGVLQRKLIHNGEELTWKYEKAAGQDKTIVTGPDESTTTY